jgi:hypothetical protein
MYILFGQSIENGSRFLGPYKTEKLATKELDRIDENEKYEKVALQFRWRLIKVISLKELSTKDYDNDLTQVIL